jgi:glycosyltransferase involved in cell wall biosynthesis
MKRPIVYDLTHLAHRVAFDSPVGIDRVDLAFGRHFARRESKIAAALRYARNFPEALPPAELTAVVRRAEEAWREHAPVESDARYLQTQAWILGDGGPRRPGTSSAIERLRAWTLKNVGANLPHTPFFKSSRMVIPNDAIYLNIAQHRVENGGFFQWLDRRRDVRCVFFLHDLLPLDHPEFWWAGHRALHARRVNTIFRHANALITASDTVSERALQELKARGQPSIPILSYPLPSPLETVDGSSVRDAALFERPYFVVLGTIEPRKNHALLFNVWRRLAAHGKFVPKLVVVGNRGWENEQAVDMLERCSLIADHVWEIADLSNAGLGKLLTNARALLMPSFAEGYGLPLVEALSLGTPVVASDLPVFRETTQGKAIFCDAIDGLGWSNAIEALTDLKSVESRAARKAAESFHSPRSSGYFSAVEDFLAGL